MPIYRDHKPETTGDTAVTSGEFLNLRDRVNVLEQHKQREASDRAFTNGALGAMRDRLSTLESQVKAVCDTLSSEIKTRQREIETTRNDATQRDAGLGARMDALEQRIENIRRVHLGCMDDATKRMASIEDKLIGLSIVPADSV